MPKNTTETTEAKPNAIVIGLASGTNAQAIKSVKDALSGATFPLDVRITNLCPRRLALPEVPGLDLPHPASTSEPFKDVVLTSLDQALSLTSSVWQVAELNGYEQAISVEPSKG